MRCIHLLFPELLITIVLNKNVEVEDEILIICLLLILLQYSFNTCIKCMFSKFLSPLGWRVRVAQRVRSLDYLTTHTAWVRARLCKLQERYTRLAVASDKVYQLLAHGRWFSPCTPDSSTIKTGLHDIAEVLR